MVLRKTLPLATTRTALETKVMHGLSVGILGVAFAGFGLSLAIGWLALVYVNNPLSQPSKMGVSSLQESEEMSSPAELSSNYWLGVLAVHQEFTRLLSDSALASGSDESWKTLLSQLRSGIDRILALKVSPEDREAHLAIVLFYEQLAEDIKNQGTISTAEQAQQLQTTLENKIKDFEQIQPKLLTP